MARKRVSQADLKKLARDYRAGRLSPELIAKLEKANGRTMEELVTEIEKTFDRKSHHVNGMTITELRKWRQSRDGLTEEEKARYAEANGCTYEEFEQAALERLEAFENRPAPGSAGDLEREIDALLAKVKREEKLIDQLVELGLARREGNLAFSVPPEKFVDFIKFIQGRE